MTLKYGSVSIGELLEEGVIHAIQDGNHGEKHPKTSDYVEDGIPFIMANSLNLGFVDLGSASKISEEQASSLRIGFAMTGDVLLTHKGTIGNTAIVPQVDPYIMLTPQVTYYRLDQSKLSNAYLLYCFRDLTFQKTIKSLAQQSTRPYIGITAQRNLKINFRDINEQIRIVDAIKPYDDLIENNRRRIQLLEESARLLYQEWFVHLRFPGHEQVRITDGVPEGWSIKRVDSLLGKVAKKKKIKKEEYLEDGVVPCVDQSQEFIGGYIDDEEAAITENLPVVVFGDHTRIVKFIDFPFAPGADGTQLLVPNDEEIPRGFFYFMISSINVANAFYARHFKFLKAKDVLVPEKKLMHEFSLVVKDNMLQIKLLRNQNRSLAKARDLLLPKLMSGELTV